MPSLIQDPAIWQPARAPAPLTLVGHWVTLEPLSASKHAASLWQAMKDHDEVWTYLGDGTYSSESALVEAIRTKESNSAAQFFAILPVPDPTPQGYASLMRFDPLNGVIEVGNILFSPSLQRTPAATETIFLLARHIFEDLGYRRFEWKCNALNLPSRRAAERFGFRYEGTFRKHMIVKGRNRDTAWFSMLDSEWAARKQAFEAWLAPHNFDIEGRQLRPLTRPE